MSAVVIGIMAFFMTVGAVDKALFDNRFGYGREFERGLNTMGPLAMVMVGIMCAAPVLGACIGPFFGRLFESVGSDPALFAGMVLGVDMGGLPLAQSMAHSSESAVLSGIGLGGTFGCILTYAMPLSFHVRFGESFGCFQGTGHRHYRRSPQSFWGRSGGRLCHELSSETRHARLHLCGYRSRSPCFFCGKNCSGLPSCFPFFGRRLHSAAGSCCT